MYAGQLVFAQLMEHLPWQTFRRIVERYGGDHRVRDFSCANQFRCMAFAQLTYRESLRDIATCLRAQSTKLYHLGVRGIVARSTLADANEARDWRIYARGPFTLSKLHVDAPVARFVRVGRVLRATIPRPPGGRAWWTAHAGRSRCRASSRGRSTARRPCSETDSRN